MSDRRIDYTPKEALVRLKELRANPPAVGTIEFLPWIRECARVRNMTDFGMEINRRAKAELKAGGSGIFGFIGVSLGADGYSANKEKEK